VVKGSINSLVRKIEICYSVILNSNLRILATHLNLHSIEELKQKKKNSLQMMFFYIFY